MYKLISPILVLSLVLFAFPAKTYAAATIVSFTTTGTTSWTVPSHVTSVDYLVVGGGGGGGNGGYGGGGGAGGMRTGTLTVTSGTSLTVTVGAGGAANTKGSDSVFSTITATGGGRGGNNAGTCTDPGGTGGAGGSGGGGDGNGACTGGAGNTPSTSPSQGNNGGTGNNGGGAYASLGGGGGGASAVGANATATVGGNGGAGTASSISGSSVTYSGGGGGGANETAGYSAGSGGAGGGGAGSTLGTGAVATAGTANTGGGGGGGGQTVGGSGGTGGAGGSGIVILSYATRITISSSVTVTGNASVVGALSKGAGSFAIDHPTNPKNWLLYHSFVESPDVKNIYDGIAVLDEKGKAMVELPGYFLALNKDFRYLATAIGAPAPDIHISKEIRKKYWGLFGPPVFEIAGGRAGQEISWQITGIRHDPLILKYPIKVEVEKGPGELVNKGEYIFKDYEQYAR